MAALVPASSTEAGLLTKAQSATFYKGAADLTFRSRLWLAMIMKYGGVEYNADTFALVWNAEIKQPEVQQYGDAGLLSFNEHDALQQFTTDVRGYIATDRLTLKKELMNRGSGQLDNLKKNKPLRLVKAIKNTLSGELYIDGNASGNANRFHGINSFLGDDGATAAGDKIAVPSDTYAGVTTGLGNGGSWSTNLDAAPRPSAALANDFPYGKGSSEYDATSPLLVNFSGTGWGTGSTAWEDNCEASMRFARITQNTRGARGEDHRTPFMHMLSSDLYYGFLNHWSPKVRLDVPHPEAARLGFTDTMNFEGDMVHYESDTPAGEGYGIAPSMMAMFVLGPTLYAELNEFQMASLATNFGVYTFGNFRYQTKFFTKYKAYA